MSDRLGTAQWEEKALVAQRYPFQEGKFWLGRAQDGTPLGYGDDRHICLVSGTRGGKGISVIINNLCFWPGSAVVVDPKGENATVTAARRGQGSDHCVGMGQVVHVLDPFEVAQVDESYRSSFNPLDVLDPKRAESIDEASRIADAIVAVKDNAREPFWDESARRMVQGLILYVLTAPHFSADERNLITVRKLILHGELWVADEIRDEDAEEPIYPPHLLLLRNMERSKAFDGLVAGIGARFRETMMSAEKTFDGILQAADLHTQFIDSPGMRRVLAKSDFKLSELKTRPEGMTLYLSLPQRYMNTHYRWLRMMVALTTTEMEITRGQPATGHPVLMVLDEFAGLKRMTAIENGVAQLAGFGVKLLFVLQSLEQLKHTYQDNWETFLANAGLKVFFSIEDQFTREYVSKLVGETEVIREVQSSTEGKSESQSYSEGVSTSRGESQSVSTTQGISQSYTEGGSRGGSSWSGTRGSSQSHTVGQSYSTTTSQSQTRTQGTSRTTGTGRSETVHRRLLIQPDEVGRMFARIDDPKQSGYPGLALVLVSGRNPMVVQRRRYFKDVQFIDCFSPPPGHDFLPAATYTVDGIRPLIETLEAAMKGKRLTISKWHIEAGQVVMKPGGPAAQIDNVPPYNRTVHIRIPYAGKVSATALPSPDNLIPDGPLFCIKSYEAAQETTGIDPFHELREAIKQLERRKSEEELKTDGVLMALCLTIPLVIVEILARIFAGKFLNPFTSRPMFITLAVLFAGMVASVIWVRVTLSKNSGERVHRRAD